MNDIGVKGFNAGRRWGGGLRIQNRTNPIVPSHKLVLFFVAGDLGQEFHEFIYSFFAAHFDQIILTYNAHFLMRTSPLSLMSKHGRHLSCNNVGATAKDSQ